MQRLLIATNNPGKIGEYRDLLAGLPVHLTSPADEGLNLEVAETGATFEANAVLKVWAFAKASGLLTLADDSGLEVDALGGEPGVHSARYAGPGASDQARYQLLLHNMEGIPWKRRVARFRCVIAIATPEGEVRTAEGTCEGIIALEPRGEHGFGYDPVFYMPEYGCTMAELPPEIKNHVSHRARAAARIRPLLEQHL